MFFRLKINLERESGDVWSFCPGAVLRIKTSKLNRDLIRDFLPPLLEVSGLCYVSRVLHSISRLDPRNCWHQLSFAIKNQLGQPPIIEPFRAWKPLILYAIKNQRRAVGGGFGCNELVLYGIRLKRASGATLWSSRSMVLDIPRSMTVEKTVC